MRSTSLALCPPLPRRSSSRSARRGPRRPRTSPPLGLRYPSLTPDNQQVVFAYRGDIWIAPVDGKKNARRLTIHEAQDTLPRVSPDGKQIAFISQRNGGYDVYVMRIDGGLPEQVTFHSAGEVLCDWSPDGKRLLVMTMRHPCFHGARALRGRPRRRDPASRHARRRARGSLRARRQARRLRPRLQHDLPGQLRGGRELRPLHRGRARSPAERRLTDGKGNERWPFFSAGRQDHLLRRRGEGRSRTSTRCPPRAASGSRSRSSRRTSGAPTSRGTARRWSSSSRASSS